MDYLLCLSFIQDASNLDGHGDDTTLSALDEDDLQTVIIENKLGCDVFIKRVEQNFDRVELLRHDECASLWLPPPRYSDRLNIADESREPRRYIAVRIVEAKVVILSTHLFTRLFKCWFSCFRISISFLYRIYLFWMMEIVITYSVLYGWLWRIKKQINKSFFRRVQEPNV